MVDGWKGNHLVIRYGVLILVIFIGLAMAVDRLGW